ncbi:methyl-accepting chemotaxis sensory transducer [Anaerovibrio sp. JC8]|uniref:methyl-accepting chemotaxis protein n=1 Tax=Anaerovibrio sp. JC8 TaxID=1240085 RepID=UPI000A0BF8A7|nr:HAMP domain-containing methyl-accepting chemotaxis protein [Anaerovibrio sp. JC8]ORT99354.1 methyl-accepting chemotaxis sensory transducer [Anaerovibrio sp. JC8]
MRNLSLTQKLMVVFGILLIIIVSLGLYSYNSAKKQNNEAQNVADWMSTALLVSNMSNHMEKAHGYVGLISSADNANEVSALRSGFDNARDEVNEDLKEYEALIMNSEYDTEEERQGDLDTVREEKELWEAYLTTVGKLDKALRAREAAAAEAAPDMKGLLDEADAAFNEAHDAVKADIELCDKGTQDAIDEAEAVYSAVTVMSLALTLVAALFCIGVMILLNRNIKSSAEELVRISTMVAGGDLRTKVNVNGGDEFATIGVQFNHMIDNVRSMCQNIQQTAIKVASSSEELTASAHQSADATQSVAQSVGDMAESSEQQTRELNEADEKARNLLAEMENVTAAVEEARQSVSEAVEKANDGNRLASATISEMNGVTDIVLESTQRVARLGERSKEIGQIVSVISGIAGQTNLLALNAAIEAARAGEQGRGFAVVAEEVRKLAEESQSAAQQISDLIANIQRETDDAVASMEKGARAAESGKANLATTGDAFNQILERVNHVSETSSGINDTVKSLMGPIDELVKNIGNVTKQADNVSRESQAVSAATEQQSAGIDEIASASRTLADYAQNLQDTTMKFKL